MNSTFHITLSPFQDFWGYKIEISFSFVCHQLRIYVVFETVAGSRGKPYTRQPRASLAPLLLFRSLSLKLSSIGLLGFWLKSHLLLQPKRPISPNSLSPQNSASFIPLVVKSTSFSLVFMTHQSLSPILPLILILCICIAFES